MKKKLLTVLLIAIIVFNFIFTNNVYADDAVPGGQIGADNTALSREQTNSLMEDGRSSDNTEFNFDNFGDYLIGMIMQYIALIFNNFPMAIQGFMTMMARNPDSGPVLSAEPAFSSGFLQNFVVVLTDLTKMFTVERTVFNEVALFNADIFDLESTYTVGITGKETTINQTSAILQLKQSTAGWFYTCRLLAMMINLCILIYVGIKMAMSTIASEEARYKKMLISWAESMIILFFLHYIMAFMLQLGEIVLNILHGLRYDLYAAGQEGFESIILRKIYYAFDQTSGMELFLYSIFFWILTIIQAKFFLTYFKRMLSIMFLAIISPFITVTYPIDKMGDGKAQAFEAWFKELLINVAMQPIHAAIYLVFVFTAGKIAEQAPIVGIIFLLSLGRIENIVRNVFGITNSVTMKNFDTEMKRKGKGKKK